MPKPTLSNGRSLSNYGATDACIDQCQNLHVSNGRSLSNYEATVACIDKCQSLHVSNERSLSYYGATVECIANFIAKFSRHVLISS